LIDGRAIAEKVYVRSSSRDRGTEKQKASRQALPWFVVGDDPAIARYVRSIRQNVSRAGLHSVKLELAGIDHCQAELLQARAKN
jgi:5,10-methylene-tetrahydrofolate dehydrogenase/methenyl tetrahydrofolate cyclohydrolase